MEDCPYRDGAWKVLFITGFIQIKFSLFLFFISKKERIKMHIAYSFNGENSEINVRWTDSDGHSLIFFSIISEVCGRYGFNRELYQEMANNLDLLTNELYKNIYEFSNENYGVPYNPKFRRMITMSYNHINEEIQYFENTKYDDENAKKLLLFLYSEVLKKLQDLMNIYLEDHAYQCKFRERRRKKEQLLEEIEEVNLSTRFDEQLLLKVSLLNSLQKLTKTQKTRFIQYAVMQYSFKEIAEKEHVSWQSVQESILTAKKKLREILEEK